MKDSVFQKIINNVNNSVEIRKLAQKENVKYSIAKIMYNNGKCDISEEQAIKIEKASKEFHIPQYIIQNMVIEDKIDEITKEAILIKLMDYVYENNKEVQLIGNPEEYAQKLYKLLKNGFFSKNIKTVDKLLQKRINLYAKLHKVSKLVATLVVTYKMKKEHAKIYAESAEFIDSQGIKASGDFDENFRFFLEKSDQLKRKKVHGIIIVSKTEEGLQRLEEIINKAFEKGNKEHLDFLEKRSKQTPLMISDYHFSENECMAYTHTIYMNTKNVELEERVRTFFHETTHLIDYIAANNNDYSHYSEIEPKVRAIFEKLKFKINNSPFESIINNNQIPLSIRKIIQRNASKYNIGLAMIGFRKWFKGYYKFVEEMANEYANDERLIRKWKEEIDKKYAIYSREDRELFLNQKIYYEMKKYIALTRAIHDIYDGMAMGRLYDYFKIYGHGRKYYRSRENADLIELIAEIGEIYNSDGQDVLEYEFGEEFANELIQIYKEMIEKGQNKNNTPTGIPSNNPQQTNQRNQKISFLRKLKESLMEKQKHRGR